MAQRKYQSARKILGNGYAGDLVSRLQISYIQIALHMNYLLEG